MSETRCCDEPRCRRSQPIRLSRAGLTGRWYFITRWNPHGQLTEAVEKHYVGDDYQAVLDKAFLHKEALDV